MLFVCHPDVGELFVDVVVGFLEPDVEAYVGLGEVGTVGGEYEGHLLEGALDEVVDGGV